MKFTMIIGALASFGFAIWGAQHVASDVQLILIEVAVIGGFVLVGLAGVLMAIEALREPPAGE